MKIASKKLELGVPKLQILTPKTNLQIVPAIRQVETLIANRKI